ncbi:cryptochrome/photolyase family protein [Glutamicibacter uratoxydans]|uniref:cryptochrome/photolyase family protein n=1 Tax=Glutamicibacter uratoxydans TaxID=43667 RepID=UPI003D6E3DA9
MRKNSALNLVWFRDDLRLADNPALVAAMEAGPSVALYILDEQSTGIRPLGGAARWWLHHALADLSEELASHGVPLLLFRGEAPEIFQKLSDELDISQVHWNRRYALAEREIDAQIKSALQNQGIEAHSHAASLLVEPWQLSNGQNQPYKVFAAFHRQILAATFRPVLEVPETQAQVEFEGEPPGVKLDQLDLLPQKPDWGEKLHAWWTPGESSAQQRLEDVLANIAENYTQERDRPDREGTSRLSPALRWGHLSPVQVVTALTKQIGQHADPEGAAALRRQVIWREFCWHLLYHFPQMPTQNFRPEFDSMDWTRAQDDELAAEFLSAWQSGETGYGLVDAGMLELWDTGWMHNRVRMVTASFLVKNLGVHWKDGEQWFWDTLVDADLASNTVNWQWVAGSGTDAAPFFRIFNPELQAKKFDPQGSYVARFAPLSAQPLVDLKESRAAALAAYAQIKDEKRQG